MWRVVPNRVRSMPWFVLGLAVVVCSTSAQTPRLSLEVRDRPLRRCVGPAAVESAVRGEFWPDGVVPYVFDAKVTAAQKAAMRAAMIECETVSPVRFVPRTAEADYLYIEDDTENRSHVGRKGGRQELGIYNWNVRFQIVHELCHALGFLHEHQRPDRDVHVTIDPAKVNDPGYRLEKDALVVSAYDFDSVMHLDAKHITVCSHHVPTWHTRIGQRDHLSVGDIRGLQIAYGLPNRPPVDYGYATTGTDFIPTIHTGGEFAEIGNRDFRIITRNLTGGAPGYFVMSAGRTHFEAHGLKIYLEPSQMFFAMAAAADGASGVPGVGTFEWPVAVPDSPALVGVRLYLQGCFSEPGARYGLTAGLWMSLHRPVSKDVSCLYDRAAYRKHVVSAAIGKAVWTANQVPGFTYVATRNFACGNETHWIVIVKHDRTGAEFCLLPGDSYRMGDPRTGESPVHWVHLEPFLISRTEVTQAQFRAVIGLEPWKAKEYVKEHGSCPASYTDWHDASTFCAKVGMRLPSESEWEYACRAGTHTVFHHGSNSSTSLVQFAWIRDNTLGVNPPEAYAHEVGRKAPNAFGLHDMHGNLYEWCQDSAQSDHKRAPSNGWPRELLARRRIFRGGCWHLSADVCRSSFRPEGSPHYRSAGVGFRFARSLR